MLDEFVAGLPAEGFKVGNRARIRRENLQRAAGRNLARER